MTIRLKFRLPAVLALLVAVGTAPAGEPAKASDLNAPPVKVKKLASPRSCLAELRKRHQAASKLVGTTTTDTAERRETVTRSVSDIRRDAEGRSMFSETVRTSVSPKPLGQGGGGSMGSGIDWWCEGRTLWRGGGHSAWVPEPVYPQMPAPPPAPPPASVPSPPAQ